MCQNMTVTIGMFHMSWSVNHCGNSCCNTSSWAFMLTTNAVMGNSRYVWSTRGTIMSQAKTQFFPFLKTQLSSRWLCLYKGSQGHTRNSAALIHLYWLACQTSHRLRVGFRHLWDPARAPLLPSSGRLWAPPIPNPQPPHPTDPPGSQTGWGESGAISQWSSALAQATLN